VDKRLGLLERLAGGFGDDRNPSAIERHAQALAQQGYEDPDDQDGLRQGSVLALLGGIQTLTGDASLRLPLYIFCSEHLLCARVRPSHQGKRRQVVSKSWHGS
jgi:hypothetical protein